MYKCLDLTLCGSDPRMQIQLATMYGGKMRPLCLCVPEGVAMVIVKRDGLYGLRRMPDGGGNHTASCDSYEPPRDLSGLGEVLGHAIKENADDGTTTLSLAFALTKVGNRPPPVSAGEPSDVVKNETQRLSILGLLHYLWDEAEFTKWTPNMQGKRGWGTIFKYLTAAVAAKYTKGQDLAAQIFIPEPWDSEKKDVIIQARKARIVPLTKIDNGRRQLMVLIAELKDIQSARYGSKFVFKHLPELPFMIDTKSCEASRKRFKNLYSLWDSRADAHMICICTFGIDSSGLATIEQHSLMLVNENWIPFEHMREAELLDLLRARRFVKSLRYNLPHKKPMSFGVLHDTEEKPTALYVLPGDTSAEYMAELDSLTQNDAIQHWIWQVGAVMPVLPAAATSSK